jgi:hypothetical protein
MSANCLILHLINCSYSTRKSSRSAYVSDPSSSPNQSSITLFLLRNLLDEEDEDEVFLDFFVLLFEYDCSTLEGPAVAAF